MNSELLKLATRVCLAIHTLCYKALTVLAPRCEENGLHPKHRLTEYHRFFLINVREGDKVLDLGCGNGALLEEVVSVSKAQAVGIDFNEENCTKAAQRFAALGGVQILCEDFTKRRFSEEFDVIILSNVLEHLDGRVNLLGSIASMVNPKAILLRVPMFEREWTVAYKRENGLEYRLDKTHRIEYTEDELRSELNSANLNVESLRCRWGEFLVVASPKGKTANNE